MKLKTVAGVLLTLILMSTLTTAFNSASTTPNAASTSASPAVDITDTMDNNWTMGGEHEADGSAEYGYSSDMYTSAPTSVFAYIQGWGTRGKDTAEVEIYKIFSWEPGEALRRLKLNYLIDVMTDGDTWGGMASLCWIKVITSDTAGEHEYSYIIAGGTTDMSDWSYDYCRERSNTKYIDWNNEEIPAPGHGELEPPTGTWYTLDRNVNNDFDIDWTTVSEVKIKFYLHGGYLNGDEFKVYFDDLQISTEGEEEEKKLLIVTSNSRLIQKFGVEGWDYIYNSMLAAFSPATILSNASDNYLIVDELIENTGKGKIEKILIIGGHDVVPFAQLPNPVNDGDTLWTDDLYADFDHDSRTVIDVPIARIPDGNSLTLLVTQFTTEWKGTGGFSYANSKRPMASTINDIFGGNMYWSLPSTYKDISVENVQKKYDYFLLHGSAVQTGGWWGEEPIHPIAFVVFQAKSNGVVVSGACYGAYIIDKTPTNSICLRFLENGARCFVGSTATSYSDPDSADYKSGLLHKKFFDKLKVGKEPLDAFYEAKVEFGTMDWLYNTELKVLHSYVFYGRP